jgi:hypothetical protein
MDEPSVYRPELAQLPELAGAGVDAIRLQGTLAKRKPPIATAEIEFLSSVNPREMKAQKLMDEIRSAYAVSRTYDRRNRAVAKARARQNDRALKNSASQGRIQRRKLQSNTKRRTASTVLRNARDYLGLGTDLYR